MAGYRVIGFHFSILEGRKLSHKVIELRQSSKIDMIVTRTKA